MLDLVTVASCHELDGSERRISDRGNFRDVSCKDITGDNNFVSIVEQFASRLCHISLNITSLFHLHRLGTRAAVRDNTGNRQSHLVSECNREIRACVVERSFLLHILAVLRTLYTSNSLSEFVNVSL